MRSIEADCGACVVTEAAGDVAGSAFEVVNATVDDWGGGTEAVVVAVAFDDVLELTTDAEGMAGFG